MKKFVSILLSSLLFSCTTISQAGVEVVRQLNNISHDVEDLNSNTEQQIVIINKVLSEKIDEGKREQIKNVLKIAEDNQMIIASQQASLLLIEKSSSKAIKNLENKPLHILLWILIGGLAGFGLGRILR